MKRLILTAVAAASVLAPMAAATVADAQSYNGRYSQYNDRDHDGRRDGSRADRYDDRRGDRYDNRRGDRRDDRRGERWDDRRYNGYTWNNRWYYGPPPQTYYGNPGLELGWRNWQRGSYLPPYYRNSYVVNDYRRYGLHRPAYGYQWHQVGDDYVLAAIASGLIAEVLRH